MAVNERRLTGRDVLNKTFQAKTKRGYDPVEVDAYLELVAAQVDMLHGDVANAQRGVDGDRGSAQADARIDELNTENEALERRAEELERELTRARAENEQLRRQVSQVAPPPPDATPADAPETGVEPHSAESVPAHAATGEITGHGDVAGRASEESYELVLRMARRSAEETIAEAHARAEEIVADANFTASQISRESDRKAFEAANAVQAELAEVNEQIESRRSELEEIESRATEKRQQLRDLAKRILLLADSDTDQTGAVAEPHDADVVDLRPQPSESV